MAENTTERVEYEAQYKDGSVWIGILYGADSSISDANITRRWLPKGHETRIIKRTIIEEVVE